MDYRKLYFDSTQIYTTIYWALFPPWKSKSYNECRTTAINNHDFITAVYAYENGTIQFKTKFDDILRDWSEFDYETIRAIANEMMEKYPKNR